MQELKLTIRVGFFFLILPSKLSLIPYSYMAYFTNRMQGEGKRATLCFKNCKMEAARAIPYNTNVQLKTESNKQEKKQTPTGVCAL